MNEWAYLVRRHQSALATRQWVPQELEAGAREFTEGLSFVIVQKNARHRHVSRAIGTTADGELFRGADGKPRPERAITHAAFNTSITTGILSYAIERECDLVIMGRRGMGALRSMLGSVSFSILQNADIPVMVVK